MKRQELINKYEDKLKDVQLKFGANFKTKVYEKLIEDLKQLDEPQKVVVPQFVADVIEDLREDSSELEQAFQSAWWYESDEFTEWYKKKSNKNVFGLAWLGGYEVEKEKRYLVRIIGITNFDSYLNYHKEVDNWTFESRMEINSIRTKHTRKELEEDGFGWVFDCEGIEIEEVEE